MAGLLDDPRFGDGRTLSAYQPTLRERATDYVRGLLFSDDREGQQKADRLVNVGETVLPPFGFATGMYDMGRAGGEGDYLTAGTIGAMAMMPGGKKGIRAYHGSPHSFDKFSMDKIGTGEGAQAYGHGLYFAEREGIAKSYRDALTPKDYVLNAPEAEVSARHGQDVFDMFVDHGGDRNELQATISRLKNQNNIDLMDLGVSDASQINPPNDWGIEANVVKRADRIKRLEGMLSSDDVKINPGSMYEVEINADPDTFLDWDKPLSEQPEAVRSALKKVNASTGSMSAADRVGTIEAAMSGAPNLSHLLADKNINVTGDVIYQKMFHDARKQIGPNNGAAAYQSKVSDTLREAGIPGIKYLDAGSRSAGDGTRNYVVFDDSLIEILRKYGIAGLLGATGALNQLTADEAQAGAI